VALLADTIAAADEPVTVLTHGPLTNLGELVRDHPDAVARIERVVVMGGAVDAIGNVEAEPSAEWNLYVDPEAARLVLESGIPVTLVPLDATNDVPGNRGLIARARLAGGHPAGVAAEQLWAANADAVAGEGSYVWDELAATAASSPTS
jgi:inosine-uridine nucleoside N-ribohydrolase